MESKRKSSVNRKIPSEIKRNVLMGKSVILISGIGALIMGSILFLLNCSLVSFDANKITKDSPETTGVIYKIRNTALSDEDDELIMAYYYRYKTPDGAVYKNKSFIAGEFKGVNHEVIVKYLTKKPEISAIKGATVRFCSIGKFYGYLSIPLIGIFLIIISFISPIKKLNLLKHGVIASGKKVKVEFVRGSGDDGDIYKYIFEYKGKDGDIHIGSSKFLACKISDNEKLLYNPKKPSKILIIASLEPDVEKYFEENYL